MNSIVLKYTLLDKPANEEIYLLVFCVAKPPCNKNRYPLLASFSFIDESGQAITGEFPNFNHGEAFPNYKYIGNKGQSGEIKRSIRIIPPKASHMEVSFHTWGVGDAEISPLTRFMSVPSSTLRDQNYLGELETPITGGGIYDFIMEWSGPQAISNKFAVASFKFLDAQGNTLPGILPFSESLRSSYLYLGADGKAANRAKVRFITPASAAFARISAVRWRADDNFGNVRLSLAPVADPVKSGIIPISSQLIRDYELQGELACAETGNMAEPQIWLALTPLSRNGEVLRSNEIGDGEPGLPCCFQIFPAMLEEKIRFRRYLRLPQGTQRLAWTIVSGAPEKVSVLQDPELRPGEIFPQGLCSSFQEWSILHQELTKQPFYAAIHANKIRCLGVCAIMPQQQGWIEVKGIIGGPFPPIGKRVHILPLYFDSEGKIIAMQGQPGCTMSEGIGECRELLLNSGINAFQEYFYPLARAWYAAFFILDIAPADDMVQPEKLGCAAVSPSNVVFRSDKKSSSHTDATVLAQQFSLALRARKLADALNLGKCLRLLKPGDVELLNQVAAVDESVTELTPGYMPHIPPISPHTPDEGSILHLFKGIFPDVTSGGAVRGTSIVEWQARRGLRPHVIMPLNFNSISRRHESAERDGIYDVERNGVHIHYPRYRGFPRRAIPVKTLLELETILASRVLKNTRAGLVHAHSGFRGYENALKGLCLARAANIPLVYEVRSFHEYTWRGPSQTEMSDETTKLRIEMENWCMNEADAVVTISRAMASALEDRGVAAESIFYVPNAIDSEFETLADPFHIANLRDILKLHDKTIIGYISNFSPREGHIVLLEAFAALAAEMPDTVLLIPGQGSQWQKIREKAQTLGLMERVIMPGNIRHEDAKAWYSLIDLFVVPRIGEYASDFVTPLKPYEAMSQGIPLLYSDRPVSREVAGENCERAAIFPAGDSRVLAEVIRAELGNAPRLKARAEKAREWVLKERVWREIIKLYDEAYAQAREINIAKGREKCI